MKVIPLARMKSMQDRFNQDILAAASSEKLNLKENINKVRLSLVKEYFGNNS